MDPDLVVLASVPEERDSVQDELTLQNEFTLNFDKVNFKFAYKCLSEADPVVWLLCAVRLLSLSMLL